MSTIALTTQAGNEVVGVRRKVPVPSVKTVARIGLAVLAAQLVWLLVFSTVLYDRGSLTRDAAIFNQARYLISHGNLNPFSTVAAIPYWRNHFELIMWPLAELTRLWPHGLILLYLQDIASVGAEAVALRWAIDIVGRRPERSVAWRSLVVVVAIVLLALNPWTYWTDAWDFHFQTLAVFLAVMAARDLEKGQTKRLWIWVPLALSTGDTSGLLIIGAGLSGLISSQRRVRPAACLVVTGFSWILLLTLLHANQGSALAQGYGYLAEPLAGGGAPSLSEIAKGAILHPATGLGQIWTQRANIWANLSPSGLIGFASVWGLAVPGLVLLSTNLFSGSLFAVPGFQNFPVYVFVTVGTVMVLQRIYGSKRWRRGLASMIGVVLVINTIVWAAIWLVPYPSSWLLVNRAGGSEIDKALGMIPSSAEVIASQGIMGRFSDRSQVYALFGTPAYFPVKASEVYFVLSPSQGIEDPVQMTESALAQVSGTLHAALVSYGAGIWVYRWLPPSSVTSVSLAAKAITIPAWTMRSQDGHPVTSGGVQTWRMVADGGAGYVVYGDYRSLGVGAYQASVSMSSSGPANVEVWDSDTNQLLARRELPSTDGRVDVSIPFTQPTPGSAPIRHGVGIFQIHPIAPPPGQQIEVRVYDPGSSAIAVYSVGVSAAPS